MIQEIGDRIFDNHYRPDIRMRAEDELFLFDEKSGEIGMKESEDGMLEIPKAGDAGLTEEECVYLFSIDDTRFFMPKSECSVSLPEGYEYRSPRVLRKGKPKDLCFAAMTAGHLNAWYKNNRMCGRCGTRTEYGEKERMMRCPKCGNLIFPRINPAVTVAVTHEDKLLVSRYNGRKQTNLYALIAGFVEIGESAEECVRSWKKWDSRSRTSDTTDPSRGVLRETCKSATPQRWTGTTASSWTERSWKPLSSFPERNWK